MSTCLTEWAKDDPEFAHQQIEKLIQSGELTRDEGDHLLRLRYPARNQAMNEVMDIREAAKYLGLSPDTLYIYAGKGLLPAFKFGNRWRFRKTLLDEWMDRKSKENVGEVGR